MKEIDINVEGYNVNGICVGCLNYNRKMYYHEDVKDCYKILADIDVPIGISIKVCYECIALVQKVFAFRLQILSSFAVLSDYSQKHPILNSPKDFKPHAIQRLSIHAVKEVDLVPKDEITVDIVKTEDIFDGFSQFDEPELKSEIEDIYIQEDNFVNEHVTSDDDVTLSALKKEKKKKKKKDKDKKKVEKVPRKLKNLPSFVELYTMSETEMWSVREKDISSEEFSKLKYKCDGCVIAFNTKRLMEMHQSGKHTPKSETAQQCDVCTAYFLTGENLSAHRSLHMNAYRCSKCGLVSSVKRVMSAHECARRLERYSCSDCDMTFSARSRLAYHRAASHGERPQCDCCGKIFANKMTLKYHLKVIPQNKNGTTKESAPIPCKGCDKVFQSKKSYRAHVVIHDNRSYPCPTCGKLFQWKRNLARHARNHRERAAGTTHACRACGKTFASRDCYNNHMRLSKRHVPESQYTHACSYCSKKFATKWCLVDHVDWEHLKRIKYQCNVCFKAFKTAKIMYAHISNLHAGKRVALGEHLCHVCGKSYKTVKRLKSHVWAMHTNRTQEKSFKCPSCPAAFSWHTSVYKHLKLMHPKRNKPMRVAGGRELFPEQSVPQ